MIPQGYQGARALRCQGARVLGCWGCASLDASCTTRAPTKARSRSRPRPPVAGPTGRGREERSCRQRPTRPPLRESASRVPGPALPRSWSGPGDGTVARSSFQLRESPSRRRNVIARCQRLPATSFTCIDAEPSCSTTISTPARPTTVVTPCGRAVATITAAVAKIRQSQNGRSPARPNRSRTGTKRCSRRRRRSDHRRTRRKTHATSSTAGAASSHRKCGAPNWRPSGTYPFL